MAERRMFAKSIVLSGRFMKLPPVTQLLYYQLCMQADDEGFHDAPEFTMRNCRAGQQDLNRLQQLGLIHRFDSGVAVVLHWRVHNQIRRDRCKQTLYTEERCQLYDGENGAYRLTDGQPTVAGMTAQDRIGKDRSGEDRSGEDRSGQLTPAAAQDGSRSGGEDSPRLAQIMCYALEHGFCSDAMGFYNHYNDLGWPDGSRYTWRRLLKKWEEDNAGTP